MPPHSLSATQGNERVWPPPDQFTAFLRTLSDDAARALLADRCADDGLFWLGFVSTRDEAELDASLAVKPFPLHLDYLRQLWTILANEQCVVVAKSRQMLISWALAAFCVWWARHRPHQGIYWQTKKDSEANKMVCLPKGPLQGRCQFIENHLPPWLRRPIIEKEGCLMFPNGSVIQALAGGADQVRGETVSIYIGDEFAHQDEQEGVYAAVAPLIQKGAKVIFVSTPNGATNTFATLFHGRHVGVEAA